MRSKLSLVFLCGILLLSWGCAQKSAKLQKSIVPPDKTLYETGMDYLKKSQFIKARLTFQTLINTYPDSEITPEAYFSMGESFYDEGGLENLLQAEDQFKNFIIFFPAHPKAEDAQLKVIAINMKQMRSPDRDQEPTYKAEREIKRFKELFPNSDLTPVVNGFLIEAQENLAKHDFDRGQFYADRDNFAGALGRWRDIPVKYPDFSMNDEVYFRLAGISEKLNNTNEAAMYYAKIVSEFPFSKLADEAKASLIALGQAIPQVNEQAAALNRARLRPPEAFSPLKPIIDFGKALGFVGPPDRYEQAMKVREAEKMKTALASAPKKEASGGTSGDILIQTVLRKSASGETQDTTVLGSGSGEVPKESESKKKTTNRNKRKSTKKP